jgi:hypothetical protein
MPPAGLESVFTLTTSWGKDMGTRSSLAGKQDASADDASAPPGLPRRDHAALPARALGPKASKTNAKRKQRIDVRTATDLERWRVATGDRALSYVVQAVDSGLYVERRQRRPLGADVVQSMVFTSIDEFVRWCDAEPLRFDDPALHDRLRRRGEEFFGVGG